MAVTGNIIIPPCCDTIITDKKRRVWCHDMWVEFFEEKHLDTCTRHKSFSEALLARPKENK